MLRTQFGLPVFQISSFTFTTKKKILAGLFVSLLPFILFFGLNHSLLKQSQETGSYQGNLINSFPQLREQIQNPQKVTFSSRTVAGETYQGLQAATTDADGGSPLTAFFPQTYQKPFVMEGNRVKAELYPVGANPVGATSEEGMVVYREAYPKTDSLQLASQGQSKEFLLLRDQSAPTRFEYKLTIPGGTAARLDGLSLAILNQNGEGLRILPPWFVDSNGQKHEAETEIRWELMDKPLLQADGSQTLNLVLALFPGNLPYPLAIDPTWSTTGNMVSSHYFHTATKLQDGRVLVAGGLVDSCGCATGTAEIYNPATQKWTSTRFPMKQARYLHTATLLKNGEVLMAGAGYTSNPTSAEIYNPGSDSWRYTGSMHAPHSQGATVLLPDGRVMIYGGVDSVGHPDNSAEIYNPATGIWTLTASALVQDIYQGSALTLLPNGKVFLSGAVHTYPKGTGNYTGPAEAEIYDPQTQVWTMLPENGLKGGQGYLLNDGRLIFGSGEIYNPADNSVLQIPTSANYIGLKENAALLPDGRLMVVGKTQVDIFDPAALKDYSGPPTSYQREEHTVTLLNNGMVLVAGGIYSSNIAEVYNPSAVGNTAVTLSADTAVTFPGVPYFIRAQLSYGEGKATGTITFKDGNIVLGTIPVVDQGATFDLSNLSLGTHSITATYNGSGLYRTSTSPVFTVKVKTSNTTLNLSALSQQAYYGGTMQLTVQLTSPDGNPDCVGTLTLKEDSQVLTVQPYTGCHGNTFFDINIIGSNYNLLPGNHTLTVEYSGSTGFSKAVSNVYTITILKTSVFNVYYDHSIYTNIEAVYSEPVLITGRFYTDFTDHGYVIAYPITGTVTFKDGATTVGTSPIMADGTFSINLNNLSLGNHVIKASYSGDAIYNPFTASNGPTVVVSKGSTGVYIDSLNNASLDGQVVTFVVQVKSQFPAQVIPTGTVNLSEGNNPLGTVTLDGNGTGVYTSTFTLGTHPVTANYSGNGNLNGSTSATLNQQVVQLCSGQVISLGDDNGQADTCGTLSYAILKASQEPDGADPFQIGFSTPVITLTAPLGVISNTNGVSINLNGGCQISGGRGVPMVKIVKGSEAGSSALVLGSNVTVNGFAIAGFDDWAIEAEGDGNKLACNWIGTSNGSGASSSGGGIHLMGKNNVLGAEGVTNSGNLISGNSQAGLLIDSGSSGNQAYNNWFGLKFDASGGLKNLGSNMVLQAGGQIKMGPGNRLQG